MKQEERDRLDRRNSDQINRIHSQMWLDGKLDKALAMEGLAMLLLAAVVAAIFLYRRVTRQLEQNGIGFVIVAGVLLFVGVVALLALKQTRRKR